MAACDDGEYGFQPQAFDEESCRFLLREIGEQIVPYYPFSFGINEVYSIIFERYGKLSVADALSVLHELLEGDDSANGQGDDGDIWRSWRHNWKHRNDDSLKPFIPRVGNFILPPASSRTTRMLHKVRSTSHPSVRASTWLSSVGSERFIPSDQYVLPNNQTEACDALQKQPAQVIPRPQPDQYAKVSRAIAERISIQAPGREIGSHQQTPFCKEGVTQSISRDDVLQDTNRSLHAKVETVGTDLSTQVEVLDSDSEQEFLQVDKLYTTKDTDHSTLLSFEMLKPRRNDQESIRGFYVGKLKTCTLQPIMSPSICEKTDCEESRTFSSKRSSLSNKAESIRARSWKMDQISKRNLKEMVNHWGLETFGSRDNLALDFDIHFQPDSSEILTVPKETPFSVASRMLDKQQFEGQCLPESIQSSNNILTMSRKSRASRRAANRGARLIDGAIFTSKMQKTFEHNVRSTNDSFEDVINGKRSSLRASWLGIWQKDPSPQNFVRGIRSLFRKEHRNKQWQKKKTELLDERVHDAKILDEMSSHRYRIQSQRCSDSTTCMPGNYALALDGAYEDNSTLSHSPVNLYKALPQCPSSVRQYTQNSICVQTPSFTCSQDTTDRPSTASGTSSVFSRTSSKREFQEVAQDLIDPNSTMPFRSVSPVHEHKTKLPLAKNALPNSPRSTGSPLSFTTIMNQNPFTDSAMPPSPNMPKFPPISPSRDQQQQNLTRSMTSSRSDPSIHPYLPIKTGRAEDGFPQHLASYATIEENPSRTAHAGDTGPRGRSKHRSGSPTQAGQNIQDCVTTVPETKHSKRSRSPVKKFLGLGKSTSLKDIAGEPQITVPKSPSKIAMTNLKSWGNKVRYGFLATDEETEIKPRPTVDTTRSEAYLLGHQSSFPICLEPPYQARVLSEIELILCVTANRYLVHEFQAGRLSTESVVNTKNQWSVKNRPQVVEFQYDQTTQRELMLANLKTVKIYGECGESPIVLNTTLYSWKVLAKDLSIRTFCSPDSAIKKHMHDAHKILEMLGAPLVTFLAIQDIQVKTLARMHEKLKHKMGKRSEQTTPRRVGTPAPTSSLSSRSQYAATDVSTPQRDLYENLQRGRLGTRVKDMSS